MTSKNEARHAERIETVERQEQGSKVDLKGAEGLKVACNKRLVCKGSEYEKLLSR